MIPHSRSAKIIQWIEQALELQLFLSLVSLPLLIAWGLPFSAMAIISNMVFGPVLSLFLTISSLILFCEIAGISNGMLIYALEQITSLWRWILSWQQPSWLIGFAKPHPIILCALVGAAVVLVSHRAWHRRTRIYALVLLFCLMWAISYFCNRQTSLIKELACNGGSIIIAQHNHQIVVIDPGYIAQHAGANSWVQYTLAPLLIQTTGSVIIDHLIVLQPSSRIFEAIAGLATKIQIKKIYLPWWQGTLSPGGWRNFFALKEMMNQKSTLLKRIGTYNTKIKLSDTGCIIITPLTDTITTAQYSYQDCCVTCMIDKQETTFYAAKHSTRPQEIKEPVGEKSITNHSA